MICWASETLRRIFVAAVDGLIAVAAVVCWRPGDSQSASVLPTQWRAPLHDDANGGVFRLHRPCHSFHATVPMVEARRSSCCGSNNRFAMQTDFPTGKGWGRCCCFSVPFLSSRFTLAVHACAPCFHPLKHLLSSLVVGEEYCPSVLHRDCGSVTSSAWPYLCG